MSSTVSIHGRNHRPGGVDPIPGMPNPNSGPGLEDVLLGLGDAVGLWKLDEDSGSIAHDSSGNGNHMPVPSSYQTADWAQEAGPPGTQTALFVPDAPTPQGTRFSINIGAAYIDDFSAGCWAKIPSAASGSFSELIGQGTVFHSPFSGWGLSYLAPKFMLEIGVDIAYTNNPVDPDTWYLFGFTRESGVSTLYLDGLSQADTSSVGPSGQTSTWIGNCGYSPFSSHGSQILISWAFLINTPLSGGDWVTIAETAEAAGALAEGLVWTTDGDGSADWSPPTIEITY